MCIVVSPTGCGTITKGMKTPVEDVGLDAEESPQRQTIATCCIEPDGMKEDCSHDDLMFVYLCPQRTSERGCIGPVNIAVGHQSSGPRTFCG
ncbi:hypothetical protein AVEN_103589-1 [Araneus ventricosus]|uniref:Uncharacterized protein n=1 Tax=Araneus ventricosus TaxID=182803 RepID=A0A4Y2RCF6_ARAVE|nr:hypothetical protein AVEN_103589-1 [Araneus ventricosus]